jgi:hypothetical protein
VSQWGHFAPAGFSLFMERDMIEIFVFFIMYLALQLVGDMWRDD